MAENQQDYELVPREEVEQLKKEIEDLKKSHGKPESNLINSINKLDTSVNRLTELFDHVNKDLLKDFEAEKRPEDLLGRVIQQNKVVADSILKLVDKVSEISEQNKSALEQKNNQSQSTSSSPEQDQKDLYKELDKQNSNKNSNQEFGQFSNMSSSDLDESEKKKEDIPLPEKKKKGFLGMFKK